MSMTYGKASLTDEARESLRQDLIAEQASKSEAGLVTILDGTDAALLHLHNAISIVTDSSQAFNLLKTYMRVRHMRLLVWPAVGTLQRVPQQGE